MERIVEYFREYAPVSNEAWEDFKARLRLDQYRSGAVIHPPEKPCDRISFILQGIARSYLQKTDGKDFTWFFHYDDENSTAKQFILIDYPSFNLQSPSTYGFQALSKCEVASMSYLELAEVFRRYPEFLTVEKRLVVSAYQHNNQRLQSLLTRSAKGRLKDFEKDQIHLFDKIPHYHIASYLGITPQSLSRIRNTKNKN
jgi:CRP-like cAMP-binding protein